ncbi:putative serine-threonine protein kinase, plant-type [Hibiscus syriacus]|uniref:Serine-threonine protein kinase, plant-type n=1 Tax=Hibiscus syriacus TaxID=106335 RepID=A0A6A3AEP6_HIBSY|nr:putative serine-threonine protein kinase, plant-type [Hibiscus syriacus]
MLQPEGFEEKEKKNLVCRLNKSLYGLKQTPRCWYKRFDSFIMCLGYNILNADLCAYFKRSGDNDFVILLLYAYDMLVVGPNKDHIDELKAQLAREFEMKDLGSANKILGMQIHRDRSNRKIWLSQRNYFKKILSRFNMQDCKPISTPLPINFKLSSSMSPTNEKENMEMSRVPYASAMGSLIFAMICTRPDIAQAVGVVSRYMANPGRKHWNTVKRILRYIKGTSNIALCYGGSNLLINVYVDSDYVGDLDKSKSTTGYVFKVAGGAVSWVSKLQSVVATSTTEAEYVAATQASKEAIWLKMLLEELGHNQEYVSLFCDSQSALHLARNPEFHSRTKHIRVQYHFIREKVCLLQGFVFDLSGTCYQVVLFLIVLGFCGVGLEDFPHNAHHREIAISISNYTLKHGDSGLVIDGGRMEMQPHLYLDPFEEIGMAERSAEQLRRSANEKEASENSGTVNLRHFAFYAFDGRKGGLRWSRKNENVEHSSDSSQLIPQRNNKLDVHALNTRHPGEFECREYRESILGVMPHHWDRREDTLLELSHFKQHKRKTLKKVPGKLTTYPFHKPEEHHPPGKDDSKKISNLIGKAAKIAGSAKSKKPMAYIPTITNYTQLWWVPNVVVAHQKEGIEAVHLASCRTVCKLHLQEGGLHADINGDGVLDHVQLFLFSSGCWRNGAEQTVVSGSMEHGEFYRGYGRTANVASLEEATPILIPQSDGYRHRKGSHGDVTAYSPGLHGHSAEWKWQLLTDASWSNLPSPSGMMEGGTVVPILKPISLCVHDNQQMILAAGDQTGIIISPGGSSLASIELPAPPTHALITEDFSNDGLTDIILVTSNGAYGFVQTRQPGALFFSTLVGCLLLVMEVISVTQHLNSMKGKPRASSGSR